MANTLTNVQPTLFSAAKEVANEPVGLIDAINLDFDDKGVAKGDTVDVPIVPAKAAEDFTPAATSSAGGDTVAGKVSVEITHSRKVDWHLTGEQIKSLENGKNYEDWVKQSIMQAMRTLRNEAEVQAWTYIYKDASRAYGTPGTTPFASTIDIGADLRKAMRDNGAPMADLSLVCDTAAIANLQKLDIYQQAHQNGTAEERRLGKLPKMFGFQLLDSAGIGTHTIGTENAGYLLNDAGSAIGDTDIVLDTGTGTIVAGDALLNQEVGADAEYYMVKTALAAGTVVIGAPGLRTAWTEDDSVENTSANFVPNIAIERSAAVGVIRPPEMPANPTIGQALISDQFGMTYLLLDIAQYGMRTWELHLAWGFKSVNPEFIHILFG